MQKAILSSTLPHPNRICNARGRYKSDPVYIDYLLLKSRNNAVIAMRFTKSILFLILTILFSPQALVLQTFSGDSISIDVPVADDIIAAGDAISINAPVDSAIAAGGTVSINAPVNGDVLALGGQVYVNSDVGGKVVAAGGTVHLGGDIGTNLVAAGQRVKLLPGRNVGRDAYIAGQDVASAANINGTLQVSAARFNNTGTAGEVKFHKMENQGRRDDDLKAGYSIFSLIYLLGYFILGLILVRYLPGIFREVDEEARRSTLFKTLFGFVMIVAGFIAILLLAMSIIGLPAALILGLLFFAALLLSGSFISFSLGSWINQKAKLKRGDLASFALGFVVLNLLFYLPLLGWLIKMASMSLGLASLIYASRRLAAVCR